MRNYLSCCHFQVVFNWRTNLNSLLQFVEMPFNGAELLERRRQSDVRAMYRQKETDRREFLLGSHIWSGFSLKTKISISKPTANFWISETLVFLFKSKYKPMNCFSYSSASFCIIFIRVFSLMSTSELPWKGYFGFTWKFIQFSFSKAKIYLVQFNFRRQIVEDGLEIEEEAVSAVFDQFGLKRNS